MSTLVCIIAGGKAVALAASVFTLGWTHSVEKTQWQERWAATSQGLLLEEARVQGSGAGMEPGENAHREGGWSIWTPDLPPIPELVLAASGTTISGWTLCDVGGCREFGREKQEPIVLRPCDAPPS
ncbi:DUF1850 domain-containing protein [Agrobacterium salinitolerans]|uniref:DUF1850 domain-containing protein n=1 Tax=Agrobacterium salinitolerans TaxID=1183413 RepID=UPI00174B5726|nr:DUF1850 domain-containing protein [Agrobacterium salinitolerans]QXC48001.1 DUF1850 domain-containing protein [Agrobacterium salinitolerans]